MSRKARRPLAVAITGGIGAGKSEALAAFARHGAAVVSSDEIVHRLLSQDREVRAALVGRFGPGLLRDDGELSRAAIADVVFSDDESLGFLEALLHPRVAREYLEWRAGFGRLPEPPAVCVTEVPLLYESGGEERFDAVVVITAPEEVRAARTTVRADDRARRLLPEEEKVRRADFVFVNDGMLDELDRFVEGVLARLAARSG